MLKSLAAFTQTGDYKEYPAFISASINDQGKCVIIVRSQDKQDGAIIELSLENAKAFSDDLAANLNEVQPVAT